MQVGEYLRDEHIVRAFPRLVDDRVAVKARQDAEVLDRAVATEHLDRTSYRGRGVDGQRVLRRVHEEAVIHRDLVVGACRVDAVFQLGQGKDEVQRAEPRDAELCDRGAGRRKRVDRTAERAAVVCVRRGFQVGASHHPGRSDRGHPTARVEDDPDRSSESVLDGTDWPRPGLVEVDLAGRHPPSTEFFLEATHREPIRLTIQEPRDRRSNPGLVFPTDHPARGP